ncbi:hypothetical protein ACF0H5_000767 [Mactra antiquata]
MVERRISMDGFRFLPAEIDGNNNVFENTNFILVKRSWQPDQEAISCPLCKSKFGGLKRRHHCRQCGMVVCNKCCNNMIPLPQLGIDDPERVCESCRYVTAAVTKSKSHMTSMQLSAAKELSDMCKDDRNLPKIFQFGGYHTLLALSKIHLDPLNMDILSQVISALHTLSTYEPVQIYMVNTGVIKAVRQILDRAPEDKEQVLLDGISTLCIYCKSSQFMATVLDSDCLPVILKLCCNNSDTVSLLSVSTLSILVEDTGTHSRIIDGNKLALQRLLNLTAADSPQMQGVALRCLNYLSMGNDWNKHRIIQEDFSCGQPIKRALQTETFNMQVLVNAVCLVANLATSSEDQTALGDCLTCLVTLLKSDDTIYNVDVLVHITRGIANFAKFPQNLLKLVTALKTLIRKCMCHTNTSISRHGFRAVYQLLVNHTDDTVRELMIEGAEDLLKNLSKMPEMTTAILDVLQKNCPDVAKPL